MRRTIVSDYDGVIELAEGKQNTPYIDWLKQQHEKGYRILIWTSRDWLYYDYILHNLIMWGVPFDDIYCGKPLAEMYIDDKAKRWEEVVNE